MLEEYQKEVLKTYQLRKENNKLTTHLANPTTANLRKECAFVFHKRCTEDIKNILQSFGPIGFTIVTAEDILNIDPDKFKPLRNLIKGEISSASAHNVKLLAWLMNFELTGITEKPFSVYRSSTIKRGLAFFKENRLATIISLVVLN